ncbi:MAG TPA: DUF4149 domain-containing protein [Candidatus Acidoferrales bacterium]|nr:DUF4149 domain-containing protein [Candidatus Acidoferrales bacterium]
MVQRIAAAIEVLALGLWIGALAGFAFVFAPTAFSVLPNLNTFAALIGATLRALTTTGYFLGAFALPAALIRGARSCALMIACMLALSVYHLQVVMPAMEAALHTFTAPIARTPKDDPRRVRYDAEHRWSSTVYAVVLLLGLIALAGASQPHTPRTDARRWSPSDILDRFFVASDES